MNDKEMGLTLLSMLTTVNEKIIANPMQKKKYLKLRGHIEKALKVTGIGVRRVLNRPESLPIFTHPRKVDLPPQREVNKSDVIADNAQETKAKKTRQKRNEGSISHKR